MKGNVALSTGVPVQSVESNRATKLIMILTSDLKERNMKHNVKSVKG